MTGKRGVYISEVPEEYRHLRCLGRGLTSIVLQKDKNTVLMFTRDSNKVDWLTKNYGLGFANLIREYRSNRHRNKSICEMPIYILEMPKLEKLNRKNKSELSIEMSKWSEIYEQVNYRSEEVIFQESTNKFLATYPDSFLAPLIFFIQNYVGQIYLDLCHQNVLQTKKNEIVLLDPIVSKDLYYLVKR